MPLFSVDRYSDTLREPKKRESWNGTDKHHYFETREEACNFIIDRAAGRVAQAESELANARTRYRKCIKKYGQEIIYGP